jgi:N-acetyl sugar amidotransferase
VRYCSRCILPDTRPGLEIGLDGVCSACAQHGRRTATIDWDERRAHWERIAAEAKDAGRPWDCVVPVSGGKDSHWQVLECLRQGLHVLAVTWRAPGRTELGRRNLDNLIGLGVDHVDFSINPKVEKAMLLRSLERFGTPAIPMHLAIFNIPAAVAWRYEVPLVVWGENSAAEYVGAGPDADGYLLDSDWIRRYGATGGTTAADWVSGELTERDLAGYFGPSDDELRERGVRAVFLGQFLRWDPDETHRIAREHGFEGSAAPRTGFYSYADVDDDFISIHHWLKWHKFGFTRTYDNLSLEIRNGRLTRDEAIEILRERGDEAPLDDIRVFCDHVGISTSRFEEIVEGFRNPDIWTRRDGVWQIEDYLIPDWPWDRSRTALLGSES